MVPAPVEAATSSGDRMHEQTINLVQGVPGELASSSNSSASVPVASNMSIIYCEYTRGLISHANLMPMATSMRTSTNTGNDNNVSSVSHRLARRVYFSREFNANGH